MEYRIGFPLLLQGINLQTLENFVSNGEKLYHVEPDLNLSLGRRFAQVLKAAHLQTGLRCVVLIDEYDKPLLDVMDLPETICINNMNITLEENHRNILKAFYSTFKLADNDLQFVLLDRKSVGRETFCYLTCEIDWFSIEFSLHFHGFTHLLCLR